MFPLIPHLSPFPERKGAECVRRASELLSSEVTCDTEPVLGADDDGKDSFVDVVGGERGEEGAESECFTFTDALMPTNLLSEIVLEGDVCSSELPLS